MKKLIYFLAVALTIQGSVFANNLKIGSITYGTDTVNFTIQWDNSWRVATGPSNWDAVWVFIKRQNCDADLNPWIHGTLAASGHTVSGSQLQVSLASDNLGVMIHRNSSSPTSINGSDGGIGIGNISQVNVSLKLSANVSTDNFKVLGIETVYIPEGQFYIGDGQTATNHLGFSDAQGANTYAPLLITNAIQSAGLGAETVYQRENKGSDGALPSTFPLGYNAFYAMKYEVTQGQYVDFLNSLTVVQQLNIMGDLKNTRPPTSATGFLIKNISNCRIEIVTPGNDTSSSTPAVYGLDSTDDNSFNQANDGYGIPVPMNRRQSLAYLDWIALRPMTEFEFEKACRGPLAPVLGEYAWGSTDLTSVSGSPTNVKEANSQFSATTSLGPVHQYLVRGGIDATSTSNRVVSGGTYYGLMEMSGSIHEFTIGGQAGDYSAFTTANGDGSISALAENDSPNWVSMPYIYKGNGLWDAYAPVRTISSRYGDNRSEINNQYNEDRDWYYIGARGVRSW